MVEDDAPSQMNMGHENEGICEEIEVVEEFEGDLSKLDSSEDEIVPPPRNRKRIPLPNPPYRTRRRERYSMLRVSNWTISFCSWILHLLNNMLITTK